MKKLILFISLTLILMLSGCDLLFSSNNEVRIELDKTRIEIKAGESIQLKANASDDSKISWKSEDRNIATVDENGWVFGVSDGTTTVIAYKGKIEASCKVIVKGGSENITTTKDTEDPIDDNIDYSKLLFDDYRDGEKRSVNKETLFDGFTKTITSYYYEGEFINNLPAPQNKVSNKKDLVDILDYMAFYHIEEFEIDVKYQTEDIKQDIIDSFWKTYFCPGTVGVTYKNSKIIMFFNEDANSYYQYAGTNYQPGIPYSFDSSLEKRSRAFDDFKYKENSKGEIDVYNSDQLIYVLEKGYYPNIIEGSPAELIYNKATTILRRIIYDDMTEKDKGLAIYSYILSHVYYDFPADEVASAISKELKNYPDYIASHMIGFYAEGALFFDQAVCHGFAKSFALLALIEGLDITKVSTPYKEALNSDGSKKLSSVTYTYDDFGNTVGATFSSHGYNYVLDRDDNKYYICDPTYAFATQGSLKNFGDKYATSYINLPRSFALYKAFSDWKKVYQETEDDYFSIENRSSLGDRSFNWANSFKMKVGETIIDLYIESDSELATFNSVIDTYLLNYNNVAFRNEYCNIFCIIVFATDEMVDKARDEIPLWGWRGLYGNSDMGYIFIRSNE